MNVCVFTASCVWSHAPTVVSAQQFGMVAVHAGVPVAPAPVVAKPASTQPPASPAKDTCRDTVSTAPTPPVLSAWRAWVTWNVP